MGKYEGFDMPLMQYFGLGAGCERRLGGAPGLAQACATTARRPERSQKKQQVACSLRSFRATLPASMIAQCGSSALVSKHI